MEKNVCFLGQVPDGRKYFKALDVFALSSDHEPFGMVLLEAMAAEVPIIATNCGGAPEVLGNADRLFPLGDANKLAEILVELANGQVPCSPETSWRLHELFSDNAGKKRFFALPIVKAQHDAGWRA